MVKFVIIAKNKLSKKAKQEGRTIVFVFGMVYLPIADKRSKIFYKKGATQRIHFEQLPGYTPDLNPSEVIWQYLTYVEMKNLCCETIPHLRDELRKAIARLRHKTHIICACIEQVRHLKRFR